MSRANGSSKRVVEGFFVSVFEHILSLVYVVWIYI